MSVLVDSDLIIDGLKNIPAVLTLLQGTASDGMAVSTITLAEVYEGAFNTEYPARHIADARRFLERYVTLDATDPVSEIFAGIRADLRRQGNLIPDMDLLIAATALTFDLALLTRNDRHFSRVPGLRLHQPAS